MDTQKMVDDIAENLKQIVDGELYKDENGEYVDACEDSDGNPLESVTLNDYFSDCLDIKYTVTGHASHCEVVGVSVMVACGGPNIWVEEDCVRLAWWGDSAKAYLPDRVRDAMLQFAQELFEC